MQTYDIKTFLAITAVLTAGGLLFVASLTFPNISLPGIAMTPKPTEQAPAVIATSTADLDETTIMAWLYPGKTSCTASSEYKDGRKIDVLKPEYYTVNANGKLVLLTEKARGCAGYSVANAADVRAFSKEQYVTVSSALDGMVALTATAASRKQAITTLTSFVKDTGFTGVEIDFEDFGSWDASAYAGYKTFLKELGTALRLAGKKLMVDLPPIGSDLEQGYYLLTYEDIAALPVDYLVIMAYDYQFDYGSGSPLAPNEWVRAIIAHAKDAVADSSRIVIGIPAYAYSGTTGSYSIARKTQADLKLVKGFLTAPVDADSYERIWNVGKTSYVYVDQTGLDAKRALIEAEGISKISVWALGGNPWFSR